MKIWQAIPFAVAVLVAQGQTPIILPTTNPAQGPSGTVPLYRVTVVQGSAKAINYRNLKSTTEIELKGTVLSPLSTGEAKVKSRDGGIRVVAKFKDLPPPSTFGGEFLTYVMWGISPEGRATNLGELIVKRGKSKITAFESLQTFGLVVTAEPYFAVSQPSDVVILENALGDDNHSQVELIDAKYELLKRGQYTLNAGSVVPTPMDKKTPFAVYQARNAIHIAQASGASTFAPEAFAKAQSYLAQAENQDESKKDRILRARESVQRAEDSRLISVKRQEDERVTMEQNLAQARIDNAKREAEVAVAAQAAANRESRLTERENEGLRSTNEGLQTTNEGLKTANEGLEARNEGMRARLLEQLNGVLQTRATARGLIVNMSGVLFQNGKAILLPAAREKLSKIAGILATHKGLRIQADGFTDSNGSDALNQRLSEQRASNARDYLVNQGVSANVISSKGFGEASPVASNDTAEGRQENRRVELVVSGEGITIAQNAGN